MLLQMVPRTSLAGAVGSSKVPVRAVGSRGVLPLATVAAVGTSNQMVKCIIKCIFILNTVHVVGRNVCCHTQLALPMALGQWEPTDQTFEAGHLSLAHTL